MPDFPDDDFDDLLDALPPLDGADEEGAAPPSEEEAERWLELAGGQSGTEAGSETVGLDTSTGPGSLEPLFELSVGEQERIPLDDDAAGDSIALDQPQGSHQEYGWTEGSEAPADWEDDIGEEVMADLSDRNEEGGFLDEDHGAEGLENAELGLEHEGEDDDDASHLPPLHLDPERDPEAGGEGFAEDLELIEEGALKRWTDTQEGIEGEGGAEEGAGD